MIEFLRNFLKRIRFQNNSDNTSSVTNEINSNSKNIKTSMWDEAIRSHLQFLTSNGYNIPEIENNGMGKHATFSSNECEIRFIYDRGPIHCDIKFNNQQLEVIYLCNFLNNSIKYDFPKFYFQDTADSMLEYLDFYNNIFKNELVKITEFIRTNNKQDLKKLQSYIEEEKSKMWK